MLVNFGHRVTEVLDTDKEEVFVLARGFRKFGPMWRGGHGAEYSPVPRVMLVSFRVALLPQFFHTHTPEGI